MKKLEENTEWKPNRMTNFLLYLLFSLLIIRICDWLRYWKDYSFENEIDFEYSEPTIQILICLTWIISLSGVAMAFRTITLMLSGNRECIFSMKMCIVYIIITQIIISPFWMASPPIIITNIFLLFFLGYLFLSKKIKERFPSNNRRIRINGIIWIALTVSYISILAYGSRFLTSTDPQNPAYQYREHNQLEHEDFYLNQVDTVPGGLVFAGQYTTDNVREHNLIAYEMMTEFKNKAIAESYFADTSINGNRTITTGWIIDGREIRLSTIFHNKSQLMVALLMNGADNYQICQSVDFGLKEGVLENGVEEIKDAN